MTSHRPAAALISAWLAAAGQLDAASQAVSVDSDDRFGAVSSKHDGRRGDDNPYKDRISEDAKRVLRGPSSSREALAARFALMAKPLTDERETKPKVRPAPTARLGNSGDRSTPSDQ